MIENNQNLVLFTTQSQSNSSKVELLTNITINTYPIHSGAH